MAVQTANDTAHADVLRTVRSVVVVDRDLPKGLAANVAAVLAMTLGVRTPELIGADFEDRRRRGATRPDGHRPSDPGRARV